MLVLQMNGSHYGSTYEVQGQEEKAQVGEEYKPLGVEAKTTSDDYD